jgi:lipopolysaccharide assembly outer membrane protein LptD (OstA)
MRTLGLLLLATVLLSWGAHAAPNATEGEEEHQPFGIGIRDSDQPISIRADELEAVSTGGARHLIFTANVRVEQADVRIESDRLEAFYPKGEKQPDRLVATGHVRLSQENVKTEFGQVEYDTCIGAQDTWRHIVRRRVRKFYHPK